MDDQLKMYRYLVAVLGFLFVLVSVVFVYTYGTDKISGRAITDSQLGNMSAGVETIVACTWSNLALNISFGTDLTPGNNDYNASKNYNLTNYDPEGTAYNVTVDALSNVDVNITMKGSNLTYGSNIIGLANITWANNAEANGTMVPGASFPLEADYDTTNKIGIQLSNGQTAHYRFWLDVPAGQVAGSYTGNYTQLCQQG